MRTRRRAELDRAVVDEENGRRERIHGWLSAGRRDIIFQMEIVVYSRGAVERVPPHDVPHVIVSITSSTADQARIPPSPRCRALLRLSFADADAKTDSIAEESLFSPAHARAIWDLVSEHLPHIERFIVHCDAGMCRSPAVAAAIAKVLDGDDTEYFRRYRPNMRVYRTMLETHHDRTADS